MRLLSRLPVSCLNLTCLQHMSQTTPSRHRIPSNGCEPICQILNSFSYRLQLSALRCCLKTRFLLIVLTDRQLASLPAPSCRNDLQICASIASFSLTVVRSSNPFVSWMVDVVDDSCRDWQSTSAARNFHSLDVASSR
jgi:hypothetical protein